MASCTEIINQSSVSSALTLLLTGLFPQHQTGFQTQEESRCCDVSFDTEKQCPVAHTHTHAGIHQNWKRVHSLGRGQDFNSLRVDAQCQIIHHCRVSPWKLYSDKCKLLICVISNQQADILLSLRLPVDSEFLTRPRFVVPTGIQGSSTPGTPRSEPECCSVAAETLLKACEGSPSGVGGAEQ